MHCFKGFESLGIKEDSHDRIGLEEIIEGRHFDFALAGRQDTE